MEITVTRKHVKNFRMVIEKNGEIRVSAPFYSSKADIESFVERSRDWIDRHYKDAVDETIMYVVKEGERIFLLGKPYVIRIITDKKNFCVKSDSILEIHTKEIDQNILNRTVEKYLKELCVQTFTELMNKYLLITSEHIEKLEIKKMTRAYGKCYYNERRIILSTLIIHKTPEFIESVILHEISHLKHHDHQKGFYEFIYHYMPDYKERQKKFKY